MENVLDLLVQKIVNMLLTMNKKIIIIVFFLGSCLISCKQKSQQSIPQNKKELTQKTEISKSGKMQNLPYFNTPDFAPIWASTRDEIKQLHKIPNFNFKNQLGEEITNASMEGKIYVANFFFTTCPNICLQLTKSMHELQEAYAKDDAIGLISHTVMPSIDTVEVLKEYGERHGIDPKKWHLVTGEKEKIYDLAREAYFADDLYKQTQDKNRFIHTENLMLIDKNGHIRGVYNGTLSAEVERIQRHIEILRKAPPPNLNSH